jgi:prevent-host-death family protein
VRSVGSYEAKTHLSSLLDAVAAGETIVITKHGVPAALLTPPLPVGSQTVAEVAAGLRAFRRGHELAGVSIRELIDEGRR